MTATGPGTPPSTTQGILLTPGSGLDVGQPMSDVPIRWYAANPIGCTINGAFPPGYFAGAVALIARGNCTYEEKIDNAQDAGAVLAIVYDNQDGAIFMDVGAATLPAYSIRQFEGQAFIDFIGASAPAPVTIDFAPATRQGDVLASFSLRGPDVLTSVTKPDLTGPGVNIYAALDSAENNYGYFSGTSMSSPHVAGSAALLRSIHRGWTPSEVKSALMLTASTGGTEENLSTPWTPDDVGNGRVDLTKAALAGFVLDETYANYLAADPAHGGDPKTLNLASLRNVDGCDAPNPCAWTRTLRDALPGPSSWTVSVNAPSGVNVVVDPASFSFGGTGETPDTVFRSGFDSSDAQAIAVTATTDSSLSGPQFAELVFHEANGIAPDAHMYVAMKGTALAQPVHAGSIGFPDHDHLDLDDLRRRRRLERGRRSHQLLCLRRRRHQSGERRRARGFVPGLYDARAVQRIHDDQPADADRRERPRRRRDRADESGRQCRIAAGERRYGSVRGPFLGHRIRRRRHGARSRSGRPRAQSDGDSGLHRQLADPRQRYERRRRAGRARNARDEVTFSRRARHPPRKTFAFNTRRGPRTRRRLGRRWRTRPRLRRACSAFRRISSAAV
jgi:hypothetical protein